MRKNTGFTLIEILVGVALTGMILMTGYSAFQSIMESQARLWAVIDIQKNLFYTNEKLASLIRSGGTVDYEEYFNRRMLGYAQTTRADGIFTFTVASHFWNGDVASRPPMYYCGVDSWAQDDACITGSYVSTSKTVWPYTSPFPVWQQPYGQHEALAFNYDDPVGYPVPIQLPPVFKLDAQITQVNVFDRSATALIPQDIPNIWLPELYLIKKNLDGTYERTYFRHVYVDDVDVAGTCAPATSIDGCLGKIQITKLTDCDIDSDGIIDAWIPAPDFMIWTVTCPSVEADIYTSAHEETISWPPDISPNLIWVDVTSPDMNVLRATFLPAPLKIPALLSGSGDLVRAPQVSLYLEVNLSTRLRNKSFVLSDYNFPRTLITTYDLSE